MANKGQLNDYEKVKLLRVQENQEVLRSMGIKNMANSMTSLVESKKTKKKNKKKAGPTFSSARDADWSSELGDDSDEDYTEVAANVKVAKKKHLPRYISPMSMNKVVNLAKQGRVTAPKVMDSNTLKRNHSKATLTMGELISSNKVTRQRDVVKQNLAKPTCIKPGSKKRFVLVDDDDASDDEVFQDANEVDIEPTYSEDAGDEGYIVRSQDCVDKDNENADMNLITYVNNDEEIQGDDSNDDLEDEDDALVQDQLHNTELEKATESKTKKRGPTMLHSVHTRKVGERDVIICNEFGQPVGPEHVVSKFSHFLGTISRNHSYAPLTLASWRKVPRKDKIWEYVLEKYDVPDAAKTWVLKTIGQSYKVYKCRFKNKHFSKYTDNKTRWKNRPKNIPDGDFSQLMRLWSNKDVAKRCLRNKEIRMSQKNMHTAGPKSFARIREEMRNEDPNKELPGLGKLFERTRRRTEGRAYCDSYDDTASKIEKMKNYKATEDGSAFNDAFTNVMNKEHDGYLRLYGKGVTKTMLKKMNGGEEPYMIPGGLMESFKASLEVEKTQLLDMRKEMEEDHQRKKEELEAMQKDLDCQRAKFEAMMRDVMKKLPTRVQDIRDD